MIFPSSPPEKRTYLTPIKTFIRPSCALIFYPIDISFQSIILPFSLPLTHSFPKASDTAVYASYSPLKLAN